MRPMSDEPLSLYTGTRDEPFLTPARILIAERDPSLLHKYGLALTQQGFKVELVSDALSCIIQLQSSRPDLLVLDPDVPWGGGDGVLARMHEPGDLPITPVMIVADSFQAELLTGPYSEAICGYFLRPLPVECFPDCVSRALHNRRFMKPDHTLNGVKPAHHRSGGNGSTSTDGVHLLPPPQP